MEKELPRHTSSTSIATNSKSNYITEIESLNRELDIKEHIITQLLNTVKEISQTRIDLPCL